MISTFLNSSKHPYSTDVAAEYRGCIVSIINCVFFKVSKSHAEVPINVWTGTWRLLCFHSFTPVPIRCGSSLETVQTTPCFHISHLVLLFCRAAEDLIDGLDGILL